MGKRVFSAMLGLLIGAASVFVTAGPALAAGESTMHSVSAHKCLDVDGGRRVSNSGLSVYSCHFEANQQFKFMGWTAPITIYDGHFCLDTYHKETHDGARAVVAVCDGTSSQEWRPIVAGGGLPGGYHYQFVQQASGKCLDVLMSRIKNGTPVILWTCHSGSNQKWYPNFLD